MQGFLHDNLRAGRLPLWNPLVLCGTPYVGNPQTWPLYPFTFFLRFLDAPQFINATVAFHCWLAGLGTYLFLRRALSRSVVPAILGALVFAFGGQLVSKEQFPNMLQAAAYLPWALWMVHRLVRSHLWADALRLGVVLGLQLLAAHAQITLLTLYLATAYGLFLLVTQWRQDRCAPLPRLAGQIAVTGVVAGGLAAGQLLPTVELFQNAWRQRLSFRIVDRFYLPFNQLGNFVWPTRHGHPLQGNFTARGNFWETCCFVGGTAFLLALVGAWASLRERPLRFWAVALTVALLMALGGQTGRGAPAANGLYWLAYHLLPGFRSFHDPARCLVWCAFALAVLAAGGLDTLLTIPKVQKHKTLLSMLLAALCFVELTHFGRTIYPLASPELLRPPPATVEFVQAQPEFRAHQARFLAPDSARVWQRFTGHKSYRQGVADYQDLWASTLTPNLMMSYGLPDAYGYEPETRRDTQTIAGTTAQAFRPEAKPAQRAVAAIWAGFLGVLDVAALRVHPPEPTLPGLVPLMTARTLAPLGHPNDPARTYLSKNAQWQPRARVMTQFQTVATDADAQALLTRALLRPQTVDLSRTVVVTGRSPFPSAPGRSVAAGIVRDEPDLVTVRAANAAPAWLILADARHPGWSATVDGVSAPISSANLFLRAVALPTAGVHTVEFRDRPTSVRLGFYLTFLTLAVLSGVCAASATKVFRKARLKQEFSA